MKIKIATKIAAVLLAVSLLPLLFAGLLGFTTSRNLTAVSAEANQQIAQLAMEDSMAALSYEQENHLESLVASVAGNIDSILTRVEADTGQLADFAAYLYNNPDSVNRYGSPSVYQADAERKMFGSVEPNQNSWMAIFSSGTDENGNPPPETLDEIYLTEFLDIKFRSIAQNNPYAVQLYLNTKSQMSRGMPFIDGEYLWVNGIEQFNDAPDVTAFDFYYLADETHNPEKRPVWTELYWDPAGLGWMVSSVAPVYRADDLMGVVGIDITLSKMIDQVVNVQVEETGFAFLMSQNGQAIAFPERGAEFLDFTDSFEGSFGDNEQFSLMLTEANDAAFQAIIADMLAGAYNLTSYTHPDTGQEYFFAYHPIAKTGWSVGIVVPTEEVFAQALATNQKILANTEATIQDITTQSQRSMTLFGLILAGIVALIIPVAAIFSRTISNPIKALDDGSKRIGQGDLTHRIHVHSGDEIEDLAATFNHMADELQAKLEEIETANTELRKLDELKSQFISMASHELRTPLIAIQGYVDLLREGNIGNPDEQRKMLDTVSRNTHRLARIVTELLDISKIEENKLVLRQEPVDIGQIIAEVAEEQRPSLEKRSHTLAINVQPDMPPVFGDHDRLAQVIINLLGNAIKYTPDGGKIRIVAGVEENQAHIRVIDNGIGIKAQDIDRLFQRFATVGDVTKHKSGKDEFLAGGTGLGLSIIKGVVEAHDGRVWVESEYGVGSTFHVTLPLADTQHGEAPRVGRIHADEAELYHVEHFDRNGDSPTFSASGIPAVLIIDDEQDILDVTGRILGDSYKVITAATSATGLKAALTEAPDVILLDVWMPGISGYDVCKTLKRNSRTREIPVIIFTAATEKINTERAKEVGADGFISKPFKKEDLVSLIESFRG
ncbi:MAG: hypothetical protein Kow0031_16240 [Anaerolineae bacterium]